LLRAQNYDALGAMQQFFDVAFTALHDDTHGSYDHEQQRNQHLWVVHHKKVNKNGVSFFPPLFRWNRMGDAYIQRRYVHKVPVQDQITFFKTLIISTFDVEENSPTASFSSFPLLPRLFSSLQHQRRSPLMELFCSCLSYPLPLRSSN